MDLKELNYVVTVANEGSISRAAEKLFMSQSSLSQAIRVLEQDLGTSVFVRTTRGVRPTAAGDAFIFHAKQILQQYRTACSEAADIENLNGGTMIFGISTYRGTYLLPPVLKRFRPLYPKVHVEICEMDSIDLEDQLLEGLLDLALIAAPPVRIRHSVSPFMRDEIMIVTTADHPVMDFARTCDSAPELSWIDLKDTPSNIFSDRQTLYSAVLAVRRCGMPESSPLGRAPISPPPSPPLWQEKVPVSPSPTVPAVSQEIISAISE